jgi:hypothetical protein
VPCAGGGCVGNQTLGMWCTAVVRCGTPGMAWGARWKVVSPPHPSGSARATTRGAVGATVGTHIRGKPPVPTTAPRITGRQRGAPGGVPGGVFLGTMGAVTSRVVFVLTCYATYRVPSALTSLTQVTYGGSYQHYLPERFS